MISVARTVPLLATLQCGHPSLISYICHQPALSGALFALYHTSTSFAKDFASNYDTASSCTLAIVLLVRSGIPLHLSYILTWFLCFLGRILRRFFTLARHIQYTKGVLVRLPAKCEETRELNGPFRCFLSFSLSSSIYLSRFSRTRTVFQRHAVSTCCTRYC